MSDPRADRPPIGALAVIVPAHDEALLLPRALDALHTAAGHPALHGVALSLVVAADLCRDDTAAIARTAGADVVEVSARNAGIARHAAIRHALRRLGTPESATWIATTDADSRVPPDWLAHQLAQAAHGWDAVVGTVDVTVWPASYPAGAQTRYTADYRRAASRSPHAHPHVHGANLGLSARAYRAVGGFPPLASGEDVALVARLDRARFRVLRTTACPVDTSARFAGRAPGGFSAHLRRLAGTHPPVLEPDPSLTSRRVT
ncbi:glycosyltransferase [Streptomyces sp. SL13]|uniref:4,4'-diaponeurosporenoate glycosyltransferase n=1 Tax=Streptantibioticus silvisoli TaxID=2705255 RepID=A0AA90H029_9ACTN|nr:glycosyltransferase [Streptantibioticus silvisoli]MDI5968866.1 glycosyltransferase [Streptantibioticus silvisoli]